MSALFRPKLLIRRTLFYTHFFTRNYTTGMVKNFSKEDNGLIPVRVEIWGPFIYVNLSGDAPPVKDYLGRTVTDLEAFPFDELVTVKEDKFEVKANWKLLAENYIDFYHLSVSVAVACRCSFFKGGPYLILCAFYF